MGSISTRKDNVFTTFLNCLGVKYTDQYAEKLFKIATTKLNILIMKKLRKIKLNEAAILNDSEMKMVFGGSGIGYTNCSTTCSDGSVIEITDCNGTCSAEDGRSVKCTGPTQTLEKTCR